MNATQSSSTASESAPTQAKAPPKIAGKRSPGPMSIPQMLRLMAMEFDRAQRHQYPIVATMITIDRLEHLEPEEAGAYRKRMMPMIFGLLKEVTCELKIQGLGCWTGNRAIAVFPHVAPWGVAPLAEKLLERGRNLEVPDFAEQGEVTLSIGVAHNQHSDCVSFENMLQEAESGLSMALSAGGDRFVQWKEVESELEQLKNDLQDQALKLVQQQKELEQQAEDLSEDDSQELIDAIEGIFSRGGDKSHEVERLEKEVIAFALNEIQKNRAEAVKGQMIDHKKQIDLLERRITKLTDLLKDTESELKRVAAMKNIETGIASLYRTVQGLSDEDSAEVKREMMAEIFQANLEFQKNS